MDIVPGIGDILHEVLSKCGLISALAIAVNIALATQNIRIRAGWDAANAKAEVRIKEANETIIKLLEASHRSDEDVAVALEGVKTILIAIQARGVGDC